MNFVNCRGWGVIKSPAKTCRFATPTLKLTIKVWFFQPPAVKIYKRTFSSTQASAKLISVFKSIFYQKHGICTRVIHLPLKNYFFRYPTYTFFGVEVSCEEHLEAIWDNLVEIYLYLRRGLSGALFIYSQIRKNWRKRRFSVICENFDQSWCNCDTQLLW